MKIATFNVNGVNGRLPVLLRWLEETQPDVVCLQELKAPQEQIPRSAIRGGRLSARSGTGRRAGTASRSSRAAREPIETRRGLPGDPDDVQSRYIEAAVDGVLDRLPLPAERQSRAGPEVRLQAALVRAARRARRSSCSASGAPVVLAGDYNVMPTDLDVYKPERWVDDALFRPEVREAYRAASSRQGWTDALRDAASGRARSTPSGTISGTPTPATPACASTICC